MPPASAATQTIAVSIASSNDDAEQRASGSVTLTSSDLELTEENGAAQTVGMRFANLTIPAGAAIVNAQLQFTVDEATSGAASLTFRAEATDNAAPFTTTANSITARPVTTAATNWAPSPWPTVGERGPAQRTPNLAPVVQSIVNRTGWQSGNALAIIVTGTGSRVAESFNGSAGSAATLHVEFDFSAPAPPVITSFAPSSSQVGGAIVVTGSGFIGVTTVQVNGVPAAFTPSSDTSITVTAPVGSTTGPISITNSAGTAVSSLDLTIDPTAPRRVPTDFATIQSAIDASQDGDIIIVAPGVYHESVVISGKNITLASQYYENPDPTLIDATVIDTDGSEDAIIVNNTVGAGPTIMGLKLVNPTGTQLDGIRLDGSASLLDNHIVQFDDAVDIDSPIGAGTSTCICLRNILELGTDDGFDLDGAAGGLYEDNILRDNKGDGVEIRLGDAAQQIDVVFRNNDLLRNRQDGIQIIDEPGDSNRVFTIDRNRFIDNGQAGIGLMDNAETTEDYRAASLLDRINLFNNTFDNHNHGLSGGDNVIALNNIFANSSNIAVKNVDGGSLLAHNLFWNNGTDNSGSNVDPATTLSSDPLFDTEYGLSSGSPAIDAGVSSFTWDGELVLDLPPTAYNGSAPDLGANESFTAGPQTTIITGPNDPSGSPDASFSFASSVAGSVFECKIDGATFSSCTSPTPYTGLADGTHTFEVRAVDPGGNQDNSPASATWTIDTTAPAAPAITEPIEGATVTTGAFTVQGTAEAGATVAVLVDGFEQSVTVADANDTWTTVLEGLSTGPHAITATATDPAGNTSPSSPARSIDVAETPPETTITSGPNDPSPSSDATFVFTANEPATFECSLDGEPATTCVSPATFTGLSDGPHTFSVTATDTSGEPDPTPEIWEWSVDTTVPVTVTIAASDPDAAESGTDPGEFTISRAGATGDPLTVQLTVGGSGTSGSDYTALPTSIVIPTGQAAVPLVVKPIDDSESEGTETVIVSIAADGAYTVGTPGSGTVSITDNDNPPVVQEITLAPVADTWVEQSSPTTNFGTDQTLNVDGNANRAEEALLRFDVDGIAGSAQSAKLRIFVTNGTSNGPTVVLTGTTWSESAVTWNTKPTQIGGVIDDAGSIPSGAYFEFDVTTAITGPGSYSFALLPQSSNGLGFRSKEAATSPPQLVIDAPVGPDTEPPSVTSLSPADGASGVAPSAPVRVVFSEAMNPATITSANLSLSSGGQPVTGSVTYTAGTRTATFTPSSPLTLGQTYDANLAASVTDTAGNPLANPVSWSFSVTASLPTEVTLLPVADTYVNGSRVTTNFGSLTTIESDGASQVEQPLLRFDVSGVASVESAVLRIFVSNSTTNGPEVYLADNNWDENTVTWATRPAQLSGPHVDAGAIGSGWYELDVSAAITTPEVYTLNLVSVSSDGLRFSSREGANPPQLVVTSG